jgi:hypothetical protein
MNIKSLSDKDLLLKTKALVSREREILTNILHHLREVEKRRLFCDLGFKSLYEYAIRAWVFGIASLPQDQCNETS